MTTIFTPEIEKCKKEIKKCKECCYVRDITNIKPAICEFHQATLSTLQMCEDKFLKFIERLNSKFSYMPNTREYFGIQILEIIDSLAHSQHLERKNDDKALSSCHQEPQSFPENTTRIRKKGAGKMDNLVPADTQNQSKSTDLGGK